VDHVLRLGLAHLAARDGLPRILGEAQQGGFDGLLVDVDQVELEAGNRTLEVIADVGADGAGADDGDGAGQGAGGLGEQRIGVAGGHGAILCMRYTKIIRYSRRSHNCGTNALRWCRRDPGTASLGTGPNA
jgi:hypothetical protein